MRKVIKDRKLYKENKRKYSKFDVYHWNVLEHYLYSQGYKDMAQSNSWVVPDEAILKYGYNVYRSVFDELTRLIQRHSVNIVCSPFVFEMKNIAQKGCCTNQALEILDKHNIPVDPNKFIFTFYDLCEITFNTPDSTVYENLNYLYIQTIFKTEEEFYAETIEREEHGNV